MDWVDRFRGRYRGELARRGIRIPPALPGEATAEAAGALLALRRPDPEDARPLDSFEAFVIENTAVSTAPLVPEIKLHLATELTPLWEATEATLAEKGLPPPFWAFSWPGGQALARFMLDQPEIVRGKRVLDFAAGCGIASIAARMAGAGAVVATEIDPFAAVALALNGWLNQADVEIWLQDVIGQPNDPASADGFAVILAGDMCYERPLAERMTAWLRTLAAGGALVLMGDPGRSYLPKERLESLTTFSVPTTLELESSTRQETRIWRLLP